MSGEIIHVGENIAFLPGAKAVVTIGAKKINGGKSDGEKPKDIKPPVAQDLSYGEWSMWGDNNLWPEDIKKAVKKSIMTRRGLDTRKKIFYGKGIMPYTLSYDPEDGHEIIKPVNEPEIKTFFSHSKIEHYISRAISDHEDYANIFPQLIFSKDKSKVNLLIAKKARQCRWAKINKAAGKILHCYESANWPEPGSDEYTKHDVINMFDDIDEIREDQGKLSYIYRAMYPLSDNDYYAEPVWNSAKESGWLDIEKAIPELKKFMFKNQISIKYHIEIPWDYFIRKTELAGKDWKKFSPTQKQEEKDKFYKEINDYLTGTEKAGMSFVSYFAYDTQTRKEMPGIKITALDNPNKDGEYLGDIDQTNTQISYAVGVDRSIFGQAGKSLGSGSGSDKRESLLIATSILRLDRDFIFEPLNFIRDYNGWNPEIKWGFPDMILTTLDKNPTGSKKVLT